MLKITNGTEKQNAYAMDIINKPVKSVKNHIVGLEQTIAIGYDVEANTAIISLLLDAIALYETTVDASVAEMTAKDVIENYETYNLFERAMWGVIEHVFNAAGVKCENPSAYLN